MEDLPQVILQQDNQQADQQTDQQTFPEIENMQTASLDFYRFISSQIYDLNQKATDINTNLNILIRAFGNLLRKQIEIKRQIEQSNNSICLRVLQAIRIILNNANL